MFVFFMWNEDNKLIIEYSKEDDINKSSFNNIIQIPTCILISGDLVFFATVVGKVNMSDYQVDWCNLSAREWSDKSHAKIMLWTVDLLKKLLKYKIVNKDMTSYEKKGSVKHYYLIPFLLKITFFYYFMQNLELRNLDFA